MNFRYPLIITAILLSAFFVKPSNAHASSCTPISSSDFSTPNITWSNPCYNITDSLTLPSGAILNIGPGVTINSSAQNSLTIKGQLLTQSDPSQPPSNFYNLNLIFDSTTPSVIQNATFSGSLQILNGQPQIINNHFSPFSTADSFDPIISPQIGIIVSGSSNPQITQNIITGFATGIQIEPDASATITANTITQNNVGIVTQSISNNLVIDYNDIFDNNLPTANPPIQDAGLINQTNLPITAPNNWWGSVVGPRRSIADPGDGEIILGNVNFTPFLPGLTAYPLQSGDILLNEIFPNPSSAKDYEGEWVEVRNQLNQPLFLHDFTIADSPNQTDKDRDRFDIYLPPLGYGLILADKEVFTAQFPLTLESYAEVADHHIGKGLNNSNETITISYHGLNLDSINYPFAIDTNVSLSRFGDIWQKTLTPTPGQPNVLTTPPSKTTPTPSPVIIPTSCPAISINQFSHYLNQCVIITGFVVNPSGTTFYLQDSTGLLKIYLQAKYQITKPRLYTGDKLSVQGVANLYRGTYRLLPTHSSDIIILQRKSATKVSPTTTSATKSATVLAAIVPTAQAAASTSAESSLTPPPIVAGSVKSATTSSKIYQKLNTNAFKIILLTAFIILVFLVTSNLRRRYAPRK